MVARLRELTLRTHVQRPTYVIYVGVYGRNHQKIAQVTYIQEVKG